MFKKLYAFFVSNNPNKRWLKFLILFSVFIFIILVYKQWIQKASIFNEGFTQDSPYLMKRNGEVYDVFYAQIYDLIMEPQKSANFIFKHVIRLTKPTNKSLFLDAGCGTGYLVNVCKEFGYDAIGLDQSTAMLRFARSKHPNISLVEGNMEDPMVFEKGVFTHVLCNQFTVYHIQDKVSFFRNCFYWLLPGGFFVVHLVDKNKFDTVLPIGKPSIMKPDDSPQKYSDSRITDTVIDFIDFKYKSKFDFNGQDAVVFTEKFTDALTMNVRENEHTYHMNDLQDIIKDIVYSGFVEYDKVDMHLLNGDENQFMYIFQKPY